MSVLLLILGALLGQAAPAADWEGLREQMVRAQLEARDITNVRVLDAMRRVPRHLFVPPAARRRAYQDRALPIGLGQTISQPYMVAAMTQALDPQPGDRVLEIGTGSGYQAAVLAHLAAQVHTIEIVPELAERARRLLAALGHENVEVITGDGYRGLPRAAPFDGILVTAAPDEIPPPLIDQLAVGGRLVIPVGGEVQHLVLLRRTPEGIVRRELGEVRFVPMTGEAEEKD